MIETGEAAVDEVLHALEALDDLPPADHVERYEQMHQQLQQILSGTGEDPGQVTTQAPAM